MTVVLTLFHSFTHAYTASCCCSLVHPRFISLLFPEHPPSPRQTQAPLSGSPYHLPLTMSPPLRDQATLRRCGLTTRLHIRLAFRVCTLWTTWISRKTTLSVHPSTILDASPLAAVTPIAVAVITMPVRSTTCTGYLHGSLAVDRVAALNFQLSTSAVLQQLREVVAYHLLFFAM
jgi:hypothetical protein